MQCPWNKFSSLDPVAPNKCQPARRKNFRQTSIYRELKTFEIKSLKWDAPACAHFMLFSSASLTALTERKQILRLNFHFYERRVCVYALERRPAFFPFYCSAQRKLKSPAAVPVALNSAQENGGTTFFFANTAVAGRIFLIYINAPQSHLLLLFLPRTNWH